MTATSEKARPVLLVHGLATSCARTWGETGWLDLLADTGRPVIGVDLLGHGDAPAPHEPEAYDHLEDRVLQELPTEPVDAVGFSLGARVVLTLASRHPERFGRLVVAGIGANLFRDRADAALVAAFDGDGGGSHDNQDDPVVHHFVRLAEASGNDPVALGALLRRTPPPLGPAELARVTHPTLVVLGDQDFAGPADPLVEALPQATLVTLRGVDHFATPKAMGFLTAGLDFLEAGP